MLTVKTFIAPSEIEGIGLFADQDIKQGELVWKFLPGFDSVFDVDDVSKMPPEAQEYLKEYASLIPDLGKILMCGDNDRFTNHSDSPNRMFIYTSDVEITEIATRDIARGEELTNDYSEFDKDFENYANELR